jgi:hypothetical protein
MLLCSGGFPMNYAGGVLKFERKFQPKGQPFGARYNVNNLRGQKPLAHWTFQSLAQEFSFKF